MKEVFAVSGHFAGDGYVAEGRHLTGNGHFAEGVNLAGNGHFAACYWCEETQNTEGREVVIDGEVIERG